MLAPKRTKYKKMHFKQNKNINAHLTVPLDLVNYKNLPSINSIRTSALAQLNLNLKKQNKVTYGKVGLEALENGYLDQKQIINYWKQCNEHEIHVTH